MSAEQSLVLLQDRQRLLHLQYTCHQENETWKNTKNPIRNGKTQLQLEEFMMEADAIKKDRVLLLRLIESEQRIGGQSQTNYFDLLGRAIRENRILRQQMAKVKRWLSRLSLNLITARRSHGFARSFPPAPRAHDFFERTSDSL